MKRRIISFLLVTALVASIGFGVNNVPLIVQADTPPATTVLTKTITLVYHIIHVATYTNVIQVVLVDDHGAPLPAGVGINLFVMDPIAHIMENGITDATGKILFDGNGTTDGYPAGTYKLEQSVLPSNYTVSPSLPMNFNLP